MAVEPIPFRVAVAQRAGVPSRLISHGVSPERADEWLARWEAETALDGRHRDGT
jgi:hypothetical protein